MSIDEDRFGTVTRRGETFELSYTRRIAASPERVWAAITAPERIAAWFAEVEVQIELRLGGAYRLRFGGKGPSPMEKSPRSNRFDCWSTPGPIRRIQWALCAMSWNPMAPAAYCG